MTQTIMTITYRLREAALRDGFEGLKADFARAAPAIVATPGIIWKITGIDPEQGLGQGVYLFHSVEAARALAEGPLIASLRGHPGIAEVRITYAPVVRDLSLAMGAASAIGAHDPASGPIETADGAAPHALATAAC